MSKVLELDLDNQEKVCNVGKALSSPVRLDILKLLYYESLNIAEIAQRLNIAASSAALHIKILEKADLINTENQPGARGTMRLCSRKSDVFNLRLAGVSKDINEIVSVNMPIGAFTDCKIVPTCGYADRDGNIISEDKSTGFFSPERINAQILWSSGGYVEYKFPNIIPNKAVPQRISISLELCSEAPNYRDDWTSDISLWINGHNCGTWRSPGDFGGRRGRLNPPLWPAGCSQYGLLTTWEVRSDGAYINEKKVISTNLAKLNLLEGDYITVRIGNDEGAGLMGGFNIFGEAFGDYSQDIILSVEY
ncbi:MAG: ArsR/SmtB family transcription factor [Clostridiaceae bacterium]